MRRPTQPHELLEQELSILLQGQDGGSPGNEADTYGDGQSEDIKKRVRTIKNRLAAKKSREQARSYVQELESNLSRMRQQNEDLARRLALAEAENDALKRNMKTPLCPNTAAPTNNKNCESEPAALPSLQLDAVLLLLTVLSSLVSGSQLPPSPSPHFPRQEPATISSTPAGVRRSCRSLRQAGQLPCISHTCHSIPA
mmetsp:Transcript_17476/g.41791  ORF Transcript_17476/g.41791 Transcript_17476/m.41791 type:complete len:198 (-) Transcript_17476:470-1063(-)